MPFTVHFLIILGIVILGICGDGGKDQCGEKNDRKGKEKEGELVWNFLILAGLLKNEWLSFPSETKTLSLTTATQVFCSEKPPLCTSGN